MEEEVDKKVENSTQANEPEIKAEPEKKEEVNKMNIPEMKEQNCGSVEYYYKPVDTCLKFDQNNALRMNYLME